MTSCAFEIEADPLEVSLRVLAIASFARVSSRTQQFQRYFSTFIRRYVVLFVERLMAREVRCRGTDRQTDTHDTLTLGAPKLGKNIQFQHQESLMNQHSTKAHKTHNVPVVLHSRICL